MKTSRASILLRATHHALRDQSSSEESMQFLSRLSLFIKAICLDGRNPGSRQNHFRHLDEFIMPVQRAGGFGVYENPLKKLHDVQSVMRVLAEYLSEGEMDDLRQTMPKELRILLIR